MKAQASVFAAIVLGGAAAGARADNVLPPWGDPKDLPLPEWGKSVAPTREGVAIATDPGRPDARRGEAGTRARLPLYGSARGASCSGRWLLVGPMAWICSDAAEISRDDVTTASPAATVRYFAVGGGGAEAYLNLPSAEAAAAPDETLDPGFPVAVAEERTLRGARWEHTLHGRWIPASELALLPATPFHGEEIAAGAPLDAAWVVADVAGVFAQPAPVGKPASKLPRFARVAWHEERPAAHGGSPMVRVSDDGATPEQWMRARDLAHATPSTLEAAAGEKWIDVDIAQQVLVAYDGARPVFATLVSTGLFAEATATPEGTHRIAAKHVTSDMDNLAVENEDDAGPDPFAVQDVPYVQVIDRGVALLGAYWHADFGRPRGRGNIALAPRDAAWLFAFTAPRAPAGWSAAYPVVLDPGTLVRVRAGDRAARDFALDKPRETVIHKPVGQAPP